MIEDEQNLLQNLSSQSLHPLPSPPLLPSQLLLDANSQEENNIITEKQKARRYYIDWSDLQNHNYFTKITHQESLANIQQHIQKETVQAELQLTQGKDYKDLVYKLQLALHRIKQTHHPKNMPLPSKRALSIESRKERINTHFSGTSKCFRESSGRKSKRSDCSRVKTQFYDQNWGQTGRNFDKMQKYYMQQAITEQREGANAQIYKQNTLKNKFLASIAQWQQKKQRRIQERIQREMKQSMAGVTFTPEINPKSRQIMKKKGVIAPIYQRENRQKKRQLTERIHIDHKINKAKY